MDRVISLLAALVGLIALGGAILVHTNADTERHELATEIAQLKASISLLGGPVPASPTATTTPTAAPAARPADDGVADALLALQDRISALEQANRDQAAQLAAARAQASSQLPQQVATMDMAAPDASASASASAPAAAPVATSTAIVADGPVKDCIPLGTRFMGQGGDSFPICKTKLVLKVASVVDGLATISGAGDVAVGASVPYQKCMLAVFSADPSGFAEMRVTCP